MKKLLKESEIRKMMKFANIGSLTDPFVERLNEAGLYGEEEELMEDEEGLFEAEDEDEPGDELDLDEPAMDEPGDELDLDEPAMDEPVMDEPAGDVGGATVEAGLEGLNAFLEAAIEHPDEIREKVNVELTDDPGLDDPAGLDEPMPDEGGELDLPPMDMDAPDAPPEDAPEEELEEAQIELEEDDDFVNEVVRRVAKRLLNK